MVRRSILLFVLLLDVAACSSPGGRLDFQIAHSDAQDALLWPAPPAVPRYRYVGDLRGESNQTAGRSTDSAISRFFAALVGIDQASQQPLNLIRPQQVAVDDSGRILVADTGRQAVFVFDTTRNVFSVWDEAENGIPFLSPVGIAFAGDQVLVSDSRQSVVYRLSRDGEWIDSLGEGVLNRPTGITVDDGQSRILVVDTGDDNIKIFDMAGKLIDVLGHKGSEQGAFNHPTFITFHHGRLYVTDSLNARVQILDDLGRSMATLGQRGLYVGNFSRPKGIAIDSDDNIYVAESYYDHVLIFNSKGEFLMALGGSGNQPGQFYQPTGLWIDSQDRLYVSDMLNGRISIFQYLGGN